MRNLKEVKRLQKINEPKRKVINAICQANIDGISLESISKKTSIPQNKIEDIMTEGVEPEMRELVLLAEAIGYNLELNLIPA